jgi:hypothetical protein
MTAFAQASMPVQKVKTDDTRTGRAATFSRSRYTPEFLTLVDGIVELMKQHNTVIRVTATKPGRVRMSKDCRCIGCRRYIAVSRQKDQKAMGARKDNVARYCLFCWVVQWALAAGPNLVDNGRLTLVDGWSPETLSVVFVSK